MVKCLLEITAMLNGITQKKLKYKLMDFPGGSDGKESAGNAVNPGSIPGSGSYRGEESGNPLQFSSLENRMDRGAWQATVTF